MWRSMTCQYGEKNLLFPRGIFCRTHSYSNLLMCQRTQKFLTAYRFLLNNKRARVGVDDPSIYWI